MPELPEVITIKTDLHKEIVGKTIIKVEQLDYYPLKTPFEEINSKLLQKKVVNVTHIAKLILVELSEDTFLAIHLNMSGRLLYNKQDKFVKIKTHFNDGSKLNFSSVRMFETFDVWGPQKVKEYEKTYGKTALDTTLTNEEFIEKLTKKNTYIKNNLLDQKLVSGIGNIYACDALFLSKIHPKQKAQEITDKEYNTLFKNVKLLLNEGIEHRGSTIDRHTDLYGNPGTHQNYFRVYGKKHGEPCIVCGTPITFGKIQGRGTYYCKNCQQIKKPEKQPEQPGLFVV